MEDPHQFVSQSDSGKSFANGSKDQQETMIPKVQHPSFHPSWKHRAVMGQDKTIEKLQKSFQRLETIEEKPSKKVTNLKTTLNYTEPEAREDKESAYQKLEALTNELYTVNREIEAVVKRAKESPFDPPLEADSSPNSMLYFKRGANSVHTDFADLLVKNKTLQTEVRNLQNRLLMKESSLKETKFELEKYKENYIRQSSQNLTLKDHIRDLEEINASASRIKSLKNISIQNLEKGNWDLRQRVAELESHLRIQLIEREKAEQKAAGLEKKLVDARCKVASFMNFDMEGQDDSPEVLVKKDNEEAIMAKNLERESIFFSEKLMVWNRCQRDLLHNGKQMSTKEQNPVSLNWETQTTQAQHQSFINELATLLSNTFITVPATEEAVRERIKELSMNEQSWKYKTDVLQQAIQLETQQVEELHQLYEEVLCHSSQSEEKFLEQTKSLKVLEGKSATEDLCQGKWNLDKKKSIAWSNRENLNPTGDQTEELDKKFWKPEKEKRQQILLAVEKSLPNTTTLRLEEKVQKLQKDLSDMKLLNQNMKNQLRRVNYLKDKTIEKLQKYLQKVEKIKEKASKKVTNLKTTLNYTEPEAREDKERTYQMLKAVTNELYMLYMLLDFRESVMKMMGFNVKIPVKEIINQLKPIIEAYEISIITSNSRSKVLCNPKTVKGYE